MDDAIRNARMDDAMQDADEKRMRRDWDRRAVENAMHYILTDRAEWDEAQFLATGEADVRRFVDPFLRRYGLHRVGIMLELGCGIGRMTGALAARAREVHALDISPEMLRRARELYKDAPHIRFDLSSGVDLAGCASSAYDMVFSYIVLQHIPNQAIIYNYFKEFGRVLMTGGFFLFQVPNNDPVGHARYVERWEERRRTLHDEKRVVPFEEYDHQYLASKIETYETIIQTPVDLQESLHILAEAGLQTHVVTGRGTDLMWLGGQKVQ